jgi:hypothetical protein
VLDVNPQRLGPYKALETLTDIAWQKGGINLLIKQALCAEKINTWGRKQSYFTDIWFVENVTVTLQPEGSLPLSWI